MKKTFKDLTEEDKKRILDAYQHQSVSQAKRGLSKLFKTSERTIWAWHKNITQLQNKHFNESILVIGDIHEPFSLDAYLDFCLEQYNKFNCTKVVFIGDIIDNHFASYHEIDADGMGGGQELEYAIQRLQRWYNAFPIATVIIGNHDRLIMRKAQTSQIPKAWIKDYKDVLRVQGWNFTERYVYKGIQYIHGEGGTARTRMRKDLMSTVQGHLHTQAYTEYAVGANFKIFGSQVGCGIDNKAYAMAYAKNFGKPAIGCMVMLNGDTPINLMMNL